MIHTNYAKLTPTERDLVDHTIQAAFNYRHDVAPGVPLHGGDRCEIAVEAVATWVLESREDLTTEQLRLTAE